MDKNYKVLATIKYSPQEWVFPMNPFQRRVTY